MNNSLYALAEQTVALLKNRNLKVATAESCTGGMLSSFITSVPGVSSVFELGVTSYSCNIKHRILGVEQETLDSFGAISENTAREMSEKVRLLADSDIGISVTGTAGPDGSEGHPPGYVFIAAADKSRTVVKLLEIKPESRNYVRETTVFEALKLLNEFIEGCCNESL